jgi:hypothetical protein
MADNLHLKDILNGAKPKPEPEGDDQEAESRQDVGRCGMVWQKGCKALDVERGAEPVVSFQFVYLSVRAEFTPTKFWVIFAGLVHWKVTVEGRNLRALYDRLQDHCLRRIRVVDRDFGHEDGKPCVTKIAVEDVTPPPGE